MLPMLGAHQVVHRDALFLESLEQADMGQTPDDPPPRHDGDGGAGRGAAGRPAHKRRQAAVRRGKGRGRTRRPR